MRVFLVRHAEAAPGDPDELRPLTAEGRATAQAVAERLAAEPLDAVYSSPLLRARETARAIAAAAGLEAEVEPALTPGARAASLAAALAGKGNVVVAVGHQPDFSQIVLELTGDRVPFAPGTVVEVNL